MIKVGSIVTGTEEMNKLSISKGNIYQVIEITNLRVIVKVLKHVRPEFVGKTFFALSARELTKIQFKVA